MASPEAPPTTQAPPNHGQPPNGGDPTRVDQAPRGPEQPRSVVGLAAERGGNLFVVSGQDDVYHVEDAMEVTMQKRPRLKLPDVGAGKSIWHMRAGRGVQSEAKAIQKTRLPHLYSNGWGVAFDRRNSKKPPIQEAKITPSVTIDVYGEDGQGEPVLIDMVSSSLDEFMNYGGILPQPDSETTAQAADQAETQAQQEIYTRREGVDLKGMQDRVLAGEKVDVMDEIMTRQKELRLPNMEGLNWTEYNNNNPGDTRHYRVTKDTTIYTPTEQGPKHIPAWRVQVLDDKGRTLGWDVYKDNDLRKHFQDVVKDEGKSLGNGFWDVAMESQPENPLREFMTGEELAWFNWMVMNGQIKGPESNHQPTGKRNISRDEAMAYFGSPDVYGEREGKSRAQKIAMGDVQTARDAADALKANVAELGSDTVEAQARQVLANYQRSLKSVEKLAGQSAEVPHELKVPGSLGLMYDMSLQSAIARRAEKAAQTDPNIRPEDHVDPFALTNEAVLKRREIVQRRLGQAFETIIVDESKGIAPLKEVNAEGQQKAEVKTVRSANRDVIKRLPSLIQKDVQDMLDRRLSSGEGELTDADYIWLGSKLQDAIRQ